MDINKLLFHMTHIKNIPSILENKGLLANSEIGEKKISYQDVANLDIQSRRSGTIVPLPPHGDLHEYVPFYFAERSPMLYSINNNGINQREIVYFVTKTTILHESGLPYVFTDGHAIMFLTEFYSQLNDLDKVDWTIMKEKYWADTEEDPDRKRRRQAEFLVHRKVPMDVFLGFAVKDAAMQEELEALLQLHHINKPVYIRPNFYY